MDLAMGASTVMQLSNAAFLRDVVVVMPRGYSEHKFIRSTLSYPARDTFSSCHPLSDVLPEQSPSILDQCLLMSYPSNPRPYLTRVY